MPRPPADDHDDHDDPGARRPPAERIKGILRTPGGQTVLLLGGLVLFVAVAFLVAVLGLTSKKQIAGPPADPPPAAQPAPPPVVPAAPAPPADPRDGDLRSTASGLGVAAALSVVVFGLLYAAVF